MKIGESVDIYRAICSDAEAYAPHRSKQQKNDQRATHPDTEPQTKLDHIVNPFGKYTLKCIWFTVLNASACLSFFTLHSGSHQVHNGKKKV
ncbi:hypothetical protein PNOK_0824500 [Pyrrhoderma noxium]|uniref:Uncharacterized protein n=1 Tax=Pyrrhoderma noxium TaxID=2282107 RepID=A0A286UAQ2_9AGAM|nr:hypothetical protein PNOK_0824500 [Pyrrhoderma noxium]